MTECPLATFICDLTEILIKNALGLEISLSIVDILLCNVTIIKRKDISQKLTCIIGITKNFLHLLQHDNKIEIRASDEIKLINLYNKNLKLVYAVYPELYRNRVNSRPNLKINENIFKSLSSRIFDAYEQMNLSYSDHAYRRIKNPFPEFPFTDEINFINLLNDI